MRPPREDYVRVTCEAHGYTIEPAIEWRAGDVFSHVAYRLKSYAHDIAHRLMMQTADEVWRDYDARPTVDVVMDRMPDPMAMAHVIGEQIARSFPDRAYFVEVWQNGREGFAQVFQPFGVPRNT